MCFFCFLSFPFFWWYGFLELIVDVFIFFACVSGFCCKFGVVWLLLSLLLLFLVNGGGLLLFDSVLSCCLFFVEVC